MSKWEEEKNKFLSMSVLEKRKFYRCNKPVQLDDIPTWKSYAASNPLPKAIPLKINCEIDNSRNEFLGEKISLFRGDITALEVDAIVNAANSSLLGGGGVDGAIHRAAGAGTHITEECSTLLHCETGEAKATGGYKLPAKFVIHTVGPKGEKPEPLQRCYKNSLQIMLDKQLNTIAFPCISTGIYGYPNEDAAHVAAYEVRKFLEKYANNVSRIIFCIFLPKDQAIYEGLLQSYFPVK